LEKKYLSENEKALPYMQKHHHLNGAPSSNRRHVLQRKKRDRYKKSIAHKLLACFRLVSCVHKTLL
jgi:hypothetical protein